MKRLSCWVCCTLLAFAAVVCLGAETNLALYCRSVEFQRSSHRQGDQTAFIEFTLNEVFEQYNGELAPGPNLPSNQVRGFYHFHFPHAEKTDPRDDVVIELPLGNDSNQNGIDDFYEVALPLAESTTGASFEDPTGAGRSGAAFLTWTRAAGSDTGLCLMQFDSSLSLDVWEVPFRIRQFSGRWQQTDFGSNPVGTVDLTAASHRITGKLPVQAVSIDEVNVGAALLQFDNQSINLLAGTKLRRSGMTYTGVVNLSDGNLETRFGDYATWILAITDRSDSNQNGIPNLSDAPMPMRLSVQIENGHIWLEATGNPGQRCVLESAAGMDAGWQRSTELNLTANGTRWDAGAPSSQTVFWRLRAF